MTNKTPTFRFRTLAIPNTAVNSYTVRVPLGSYIIGVIEQGTSQALITIAEGVRTDNEQQDWTFKLVPANNLFPSFEDWKILGTTVVAGQLKAIMMLK